MLNLKTGDIIRGRTSGESFVVTANYGDHVTAVQTVDVTNADEWELLVRSETGLRPPRFVPVTVAK